MQKIIVLYFITSLLTITNNCSGMLQRTLRAEKYIRTYRMKSLPAENIFNATDKDLTTILELRKDIHYRNNRTINDLEQQIERLKKQNHLVIYNPFDREALKYLEIQIHEGFTS